MRLIDADTLIKNLSYLYTKNHIPVDMRAKEILTTIMEQPTAYNVDKVISQLGDYGNEEIEYYRNTPYENCIRGCVSKAIEIVKQGGVADDVCGKIK